MIIEYITYCSACGKFNWWEISTEIEGMRISDTPEWVKNAKKCINCNSNKVLTSQAESYQCQGD